MGELKAVSATGTYQSPSIVDLRVPVPRNLTSIWVHEAKEHRRLARATVLTLGGLVISGLSALGSFLLAGDEIYASLWVIVASSMALGRLISQGRRLRGDIPRGLGIADEVMAGLRIATVGSLVGVVATVLIETVQSIQYPRGLLLAEWVMSLVLWVGFLVGTKLVVSRFRREGKNIRQILVIGTTAVSRRFVDHVERHPETGYRVTAVVPYQFSAGFAEPAVEEQTISGPPLEDHGRSHDLPTLISELAVDDLIFAQPIPRHQLIRLLASCPQALTAHQLSSWADGPSVRAGESLSGFPVVDLLLPSARPSSALFKRAMDLALALTALALSLSLLIVSGLLIALTSRGPVIFKQVRIGQHGQPFVMYKLRTMRAGTDPSVHKEYVWSLMNSQAGMEDGKYKMSSPETTRVGKWLRRLSIDEVPQLWNVITGTMSLVGPRPPMPYEIPMHDSRQLRRLDVKPGVTGLWQVSERNNVGYREMVELDLRYIEHWSLKRDLRIILKTPAAVVKARATS